jgi:hypothetical protein
MKTHSREKTSTRRAEFALDGRIFISKLVSFDSLQEALRKVEQEHNLVIKLEEDLHPHGD